MTQDHGLDTALDNTHLLEICKPALDGETPVRATLPIRNVNRVVGTIVGSEVTRRYGPQGLPEDTIKLTFNGSAGQSFGAFLPPGMTLILNGDANDYLGKGLSGGKIVIMPPAGSTFIPREKHHHRQHRPLRRDGRRGLHPGRSGRTVRGPQFRRPCRRGGRGRPWL